MSLLKKYKPWELKEFAIIYHLLMWGKTSSEVVSITEDELLNRHTKDAIHGQVGEIRRWISKTMGYPIGEEVSKRASETFNRASKIRPIEDILQYKPIEPSKHDFIPVRVHKRKVQPSELPVVKPLPENTEELVKQLNEQQLKEAREAIEAMNYMEHHPNRVKPEPTIIEVIEAAKAMGVKEVEYKGLLLRF